MAWQNMVIQMLIREECGEYNQVEISLGFLSRNFRFVRFPKFIVTYQKELGISNDGLAFLLHCYWYGDSCFASMSTIAERMGKSVDSIRRYANELEHNELIMRYYRIVNEDGEIREFEEYTNIIPPKWKYTSCRYDLSLVEIKSFELAIEHNEVILQEAEQEILSRLNTNGGTGKSASRGGSKSTGRVLADLQHELDLKEQDKLEQDTTNPPICEKDSQIGISDGDFSNGVQNNTDSGGSDTDDSIHSETDKIGGEANEVHSDDYKCSSGDSNISVDQEKDIEKLTYVQAVVAHWNGLADRYKDKISQRTTRPAKLSSVDKFAKGKYRAALQWYNAGIPLDKICEALDTWVGAHVGSPVPLNYFANHELPVVVDESEITPEAREWARKFMEEE